MADPAASSGTTETTPDPYTVLPQITFANSLTIYAGDWPIVIQHVGGATPESVWVHLPHQMVLFAGDLVTTKTPPLVSEGDIAAWLDVLARIGKPDWAVRLIVPGRGSPCRKAALASVAGCLRTMQSRVRSLIRARRPRSDTARLVPEILARYSVPADERENAQRRVKAGLEHIYDTLRSKK